MLTKARISSRLTKQGLNGPCGSSGFPVIEINRQKTTNRNHPEKALSTKKCKNVWLWLKLLQGIEGVRGGQQGDP